MCPPNGFESNTETEQILRHGVQILDRARSLHAVEFEEGDSSNWRMSLFLAWQAKK